MAQLPRETLDEIATLKTEWLIILNKAAVIADQLFQRYGETQETLQDLSELAVVIEKISSLYTSLSTLLLRVAEAQPGANLATMKKLTQTVQAVQLSHTASVRSIDEVKERWSLPG